MSYRSKKQEPRLTVPKIRARKGAEKIVVLTAYTAPIARILDGHCDILLVGDSLGMVLYDYESTLPVTLRTMMQHGAAVVRASQKALVVVDLPFGSYQASPERAFRAAALVLKQTGCGAVKLEGGAEMAPTIKFLTERGIPVMAHIALTPQHVHTMGGYKVQGKTPASATKLLNDALAVEKAGAFAIVLEGIKEEVAKKITQKLKIPTIGIGASAACDGQVLVTEDMVNLTPGAKPKFVEIFGDAGAVVDKAAASYAKEVRAGKFPGKKNIY